MLKLRFSTTAPNYQVRITFLVFSPFRFIIALCDQKKLVKSDFEEITETEKVNEETRTFHPLENLVKMKCGKIKMQDLNFTILRENEGVTNFIQYFVPFHFHEIFRSIDENF